MKHHLASFEEDVMIFCSKVRVIMKELLSQSKKNLQTWLLDQGHKKFHATQILDWVFQKSVISFDEMTNLSKSLKEELKKSFKFPLLELVRTTTSSDEETIKFLWKLSDQRFVESVLILSGDRRTLCVSSQVGCPGRCAFCASGKKGFIRNLTAAEILEQLLRVNKYLQDKEEKVSHIVFMGMGEPLENYDQVTCSIRSITDPELFGISQRKVTVSTVGVVENIHKLSNEEDFNVNLVLSLHAPNQNIRKKIIPYARKYSYEEVLKAMKFYYEKTKREITYEYTLIESLNDSKKDAAQLAKMLKGHPCTVNLIPYNPVEGLNLKRPSSETIHEFQDVLKQLGIRTTWRYTKGKDIAAACGQLALKEAEASQNNKTKLQLV